MFAPKPKLRDSNLKYMKRSINSLLTPFIFIISMSVNAQEYKPWMQDKNLYEYQEFSVKDGVDPKIHLSCEKEIIEGEYDRKSILWRVINLSNDPINVDIRIDYELTCKKVRSSTLKNFPKKPINPGEDNAVLNDAVSDQRESGTGWYFLIKKECGDGIELKDIKIIKCSVTPVKSKESVTPGVQAPPVPLTPEDKAKEQAEDKAMYADAKKKADSEMKQQKENQAQAEKDKKELAEKEKQDKKMLAANDDKSKKANQDKSKQEKKDADLKAKQDKKDTDLKAKQDKKDADLKAKKDKKDQEEKIKNEKSEKDAQAKLEKKQQQEKTKTDEKTRKDIEAQNKKNGNSKGKNNTEPSVVTENAPTKIPPIQDPPKEIPPVQQNNIATTNTTSSQSKAVPAESSDTIIADEPEDTLVFKDQTLKIYASEFREKAFNKVRDLNNKLRFLVDTSNSETQMNRVLEEGVKLFVDENRVIEISNINNQDKKSYNVRAYLMMIKSLPYARVEVSWTKIEIVTAFQKQPDGTYRATAEFEQEFSGYRDEIKQYSDITDKKVEIIIKPKIKIVGTESQTVYEVYLGNIGVVQTKRG